MLYTQQGKRAVLSSSKHHPIGQKVSAPLVAIRRLANGILLPLNFSVYFWLNLRIKLYDFKLVRSSGERRSVT